MVGIDSSTTACKAVVWDARGQAVAAGRAALPMLKPQPAWHEQPVESWQRAAQKALRQALAQVEPSRLAGVCITTQRETFALADENGLPLGPALLWMDERARASLDEIDHLYGKGRVHQETGKPLSANLSLAKLLWLKNNRPEWFPSPPLVLDVHASLAHFLTGEFVTSWGCADPMGLFDMRSGAWHTGMLTALGLGNILLPAALPVGAPAGAVTAAAARRTGLPAGLPLFAGLGDGQAAGLGVCAVHPGEAYLNLGTAVVSGAYSADYRVDPAFRSMYGGLPGSYFFETVLLGGAYTITWFMENFASAGGAKRPSEAVMEAAAAQIPPGAQGLVLVPYWNSAMNPYWDASASGIVAGWRGIHTRAHLYRAILEGIALEQRLHTLGVERALGRPVERYIAVGGGARSPLWRQIIADVTGKPVYRAEAPEASALGAGILAAAGCGLHPGVLPAAQAMTRIHPDPALPDPARAEFYTRLYEEVYRGLFPALQPALQRLSGLADRPGTG
jgi:xylulokinase